MSGAREIYVCATHAVFSPPAIERLSSGYFHEVQLSPSTASVLHLLHPFPCSTCSFSPAPATTCTYLLKGPVLSAVLIRGIQRSLECTRISVVVVPPEFTIIDLVYLRQEIHCCMLTPEMLLLQVIVTNTIPTHPDRLFPELTVLSVANLLGETIWRVYNSSSVQSLL